MQDQYTILVSFGFTPFPPPSNSIIFHKLFLIHDSQFLNIVKLIILTLAAVACIYAVTYMVNHRETCIYVC